MLALADLREDPRILSRLLEALEGALDRFAFLDANAGHATTSLPPTQRRRDIAQRAGKVKASNAGESASQGQQRYLERGAESQRNAGSQPAFYGPPRSFPSTRFRPSFFARYKNRSAAEIRSSG